MCCDSTPVNKEDSFYLCEDDVTTMQDLAYRQYCDDFVPLNLAMIYRFCSYLQKSLDGPEFEGIRLIHITRNSYDKKADTALLMGTFQILALGALLR